MNTVPTFPKYIHKGDIIPHPIFAYGRGIVTEVRFTPASKTPGRPEGVVSGWMKCSGCKQGEGHEHAFSYPADTLVPVTREPF